MERRTKIFPTAKELNAVVPTDLGLDSSSATCKMQDMGKQPKSQFPNEQWGVIIKLTSQDYCKEQVRLGQ